MADHVRTQIRHAIEALLVGATDAGANVFISHPFPLTSAQLPGIKIDSILPGRHEPSSTGGPSRLRTRLMPLTIAVCVKEVSGYQESADTIFKQIEVLLANNNTLGGLCKWINPITEPGVSMAEGDVRACVAEQVFEVVYVTALNAPDVPR